MKRIGTISIALSFIFLGVSLLVAKFDPNLGYSIFKFWPAIFIVLGLEFILSTVMGKEIVGQKKRFNLWVIFVVIAFLAVDGAWSFKESNFFESIKEGITNSFDGNYETKDFNFTVDKDISDISINVTNADIKIEKSQDGMVGFQGELDVNHGISADVIEYLNTTNNKATLNLKRSGIRRLKGTLFIKEDSKLTVDITNGKIEGKGEFGGVTFKSSSTNAAYDLEGFKTLDLKNTNGEMKVRNSQEIVFRNVNGGVEIYGVQTIKGENKNGQIEINTDKVKNIYVENSIGQISFETSDKNITINADVKTGKINYDSGFDSSKNKSLRKVIGSGEGKVTLINSLGSIEIDCKE